MDAEAEAGVEETAEAGAEEVAEVLEVLAASAEVAVDVLVAVEQEEVFNAHIFKIA